MDPALPAALRVAINLRLEGRPREDLARRAGDLSEGYRQGRASSALVRGVEDALAYALTRTPATYAAVRRALEETHALDPDFRPLSLLDAGAGPGVQAGRPSTPFPASQRSPGWITTRPSSTSPDRWRHRAPRPWPARGTCRRTLRPPTFLRSPGPTW